MEAPASFRMKDECLLAASPRCLTEGEKYSELLQRDWEEGGVCVCAYEVEGEAGEAGG